jgi:hypothetical protein
MQIDGGLRPITEDEALAIRREAALAIQAIYADLDFPAISDQEIEAAACAHSSDDMPERDLIADLAAADGLLKSNTSILRIVQALADNGFTRTASNVLEMGRQRIAGDYLQPSAIFDREFKVQSAINDANDYQGPGTGYRLENARWEEIQAIPQARSPQDFIADQLGEPLAKLLEIGPAAPGTQPEVVLAVGPGFGTALTRTINGIPHEDVLAAILSGIAQEDMIGRIIKVYHSADCAAIGHVGARLSGSGIGIGLQSRGTTVIQQRDLAPLNNLELFPQSPSLTLESYEAIGRNAARYAKGETPAPIAVKIDNGARLRLIVKTTLLHRREADQVDPNQPPVELLFDWEPD